MFRKLSTTPCLSFLLAVGAAAPSLAQYGEYPGEEVYHLTAWVDPAHGTDSATPSNQINDANLPFKTLNGAIEAVYDALVDFNPGGALLTEGTVYALPGVYGPVGGVNGPNASGDQLPIRVLDRVHVKGLGARRCIIRGNGTNDEHTIFWPTDSEGFVPDAEILVDLRYANMANIPPGGGQQPPWYDQLSPEDDTFEVFDGFTLQGGDVQVFALSGGNSYPSEPRAILSNCIFDMRDGFEPVPGSGNSVEGPSFGVFMSKSFAFTNGYGYIDHKLLILNNTFVMAQFGATDWLHESKSDAVAIIDVSNPICSIIPRDCDETLRGLGNAGIVNNLFRTRPGTSQMAMLGIDEVDTHVMVGGVPIQTNAFAGARVGATNGTFQSQPVGNTAVSSPAIPANGQPDYWDCGGASQAEFSLDCGLPCTPNHTCVPGVLPMPVVAIYDGSANECDPAFVGEYLASAFPSLTGYTDWRLLPGRPNRPNPLAGMGYGIAGPGSLTMENGTVFPIADLPGTNPFEWDSEGYGNMRRVEGIDIGADELHLMTMAGSWGNDSASHGTPGYLNPDARPGQTDRHVILPIKAGGVALNNKYVRINGQRQVAPSAPTVPTAWDVPPGTLQPPSINTSLPNKYQTKYVKSSSAGSPAPWTMTLTSADQVIGYVPLNGALSIQTLDFFLVTISDDECSPLPCDESYFNTQAIVKTASGGSALLRGNMQAEYR